MKHLGLLCLSAALVACGGSEGGGNQAPSLSNVSIEVDGIPKADLQTPVSIGLKPSGIIIGINFDYQDGENDPAKGAEVVWRLNGEEVGADTTNSEDYIERRFTFKVGEGELTAHITPLAAAGTARGDEHVVGPILLERKPIAFFTAFSDTGSKEDYLMATDNTPDGTVKLQSFNEGAENIGEAVAINNVWLMPVYDGYGEKHTLASTNGISFDTEAFDVNVQASNLFRFADRVLFSGYQEGSGSELWVSYGVNSASSPEKSNRQLMEIRSGADGSSPHDFFQLNDAVLFSAHDGAHGDELWITDGTASGTELFKDIYGGSISSNPSSFTALGNQAIFVANSAEYGNELWITDGTSAGTHVLKDLTPRQNNEVRHSNPTFLSAAGGFVYFRADDLDGIQSVWRTDGTSAGTEKVSPLDPTSILGWKDKVVFSSEDDQLLWGTSSSDLKSISGLSNFRNLRATSDMLFFEAFDSTEGHGLYSFDGNEQGSVTRVYQGLVYSRAVNGDKLLFSANSADAGQELFITDGRGDAQLLDLNPGSASSTPQLQLNNVIRR